MTGAKARELALGRRARRLGSVEAVKDVQRLNAGRPGVAVEPLVRGGTEDRPDHEGQKEQRRHEPAPARHAHTAATDASAPGVGREAEERKSKHGPNHHAVYTCPGGEIECVTSSRSGVAPTLGVGDSNPARPIRSELRNMPRLMHPLVGRGASAFFPAPRERCRSDLARAPQVSGHRAPGGRTTSSASAAERRATTRGLRRVGARTPPMTTSRRSAPGGSTSGRGRHRANGARPVRDRGGPCLFLGAGETSAQLPRTPRVKGTGRVVLRGLGRAQRPTGA